MGRASAFLRYLLTIFGPLVVMTEVVVGLLFPEPLAQWSRSALSTALSFDAAAFLREHVLAVAIAGGGLVVLALIWLPKWQAARPELTPEARFEAENEARKTLAEIIGGAAVLAGLLFTWENLRITQETATTSQELTREGQLTERFTKAIDQLGAVNDKGEKQLEIRLGGIYALEQIARDSKKDHWPIVEVLTAYVREHAPWPPKSPKDTPRQPDNSVSKGNQSATQSQPRPKPATDIQVVLTVLGRRDRTSETEDQRLDLSETNLRGVQLRGAHLEKSILRDAHLEMADLRGTHLEMADLRGAHLEMAILWGAHLEIADLRDAHLEKAILWDAHLEKATLWGAHLEEADLWDAHLKEATLRGAHLEEAQLRGAHLEMADLRGAHLEEADLRGAHLTVEQLCSVRTLYQAQLDPPLTEQIRQQCP
jgi:uncharacterized protein YjbI with pentapeptide repeats